MNWNKRYAMESCIFCGKHHQVHVAIRDQWSVENFQREGLPRPRAERPGLDGSVVRYQVPGAATPGPEGPLPDGRAEIRILAEHRCPMCLEQFKPGQTAVRWKGHHDNRPSDGATDIFPFHVQCMDNIVRRQCPHFTEDPDRYDRLSDYEQGPYEQIRGNSETRERELFNTPTPTPTLDPKDRKWDLQEVVPHVYPTLQEAIKEVSQ